ncbi:hypothetical protein MKY37_19365 [Psychrobacillus sp. FSL K6-2836]|uniref:hypothetical protein n=1 Tax=Psychrobacillus sp. FSL K6-2836 TaxID=2921548 RepID=UPI0030F7A8D6
MSILLIYKELNKLVDDYYKCPELQIKEQILSDLKFLTDALLLMDQEHNSEITL